MADSLGGGNQSVERTGRSRVGVNTRTMSNSMTESTLTQCQSRLYRLCHGLIIWPQVTGGFHIVQCTYTGRL
jgi:hypothetical protein